MKTVSNLIACLALSLSVYSQTYMDFKPKHLVNVVIAQNEGIPIFTYSQFKIEDYQKVVEAFNFLKNSSKIQFNYPQDNCHNRAEIMSMFLKKKNISHFKIWNFAPSKMTFFSSQMLEVPDKNNFSPTGKIHWGFHVAPTVLAKVNGKLDTLVLDPSLFDKPITYRKWLLVQNCKASYYTFLNSEYYLFYSINGSFVHDYEDYDQNCTTDNDIQLPNYLPKVMTGDFYMYSGSRVTQQWVEKGMAINDMAYQFYTSELLPIINDPSKAELVKEYKILFGSVNNVESIYLEYPSKCKLDPDLLEKHKAILDKYREIFIRQTSKWVQIVQELH
ncbi:hypothetical protein ABID42_002559 [Arcicella rosea]|uniref:protein-glutamine glutaminase family protein n=1 Tax=Arcicella rosea TaxID=502909 RepID=UPI00345D9FDF